MKTTCLAVICFCILFSQLLAEETPKSSSFTATRILGDIPDGAPPPQESPKGTFIPEALEVVPFTPPAPVLRKALPAVRIDSAIAVTAKSSRTLTIQRGAASTLPDLPQPPAQEIAAPSREATPQELADFAALRRRDFNLGATVYDHRVSEISWTNPDTGDFYQATCGFDIGLLAGIGGFTHEGEDYSLMLMHSHEDSSQALNREDSARIAKIIPDQVHITLGNPKNPQAIQMLEILQKVITSEKPRLLTYQAAREQYQLAAAAWDKANPPVPRDETFLIRPHRGSRYLLNPKPIDTIR